jgi:hypothetical protein
MDGVVSFNYPGWAARYPELASWVNATLAAAYFAEAAIYCDNTPCSIVGNLDQRAVLLNMLTAHIAALNAPLNGQPASPLVGRINSATEGSVSVQTAYDVPAGTAQWYAQTKYGAAYWAASAQYRTMRYVPSPGRPQDPFRQWQ